MDTPTARTDFEVPARLRTQGVCLRISCAVLQTKQSLVLRKPDQPVLRKTGECIKTNFSSNSTMRPWASRLISSMQWKWSLPLQVRCHIGDQAPRLGQDSRDTAGAPYVLMQFTAKRALARPVVFLSCRTQAKDS